MTVKDETYQYILSNMRDGWLTVKGGAISFGNRRAEKILGLKLSSDISISTLSEDSRNDGFVQALIDAVTESESVSDRIVTYVVPDTQEEKTLCLSIKKPATPEDLSVVLLLSDITESEKLRKQKNLSVLLLTMMLVVLCCMTYLYAVLSTFIEDSDKINDIVAFCVMWSCVGLSVFVWLTRLKGRTIKQVLLTPHTGRACVQALVLTAGIFVFMLALKIVLVKTGSPFFPESSAIFVSGDVLRTYFISTYPFSVLFQEYAAREVMQSALETIYSGKHSGIVSITVSAVYFGAIHFEFGPVMAFGAAIMMGGFGVFYRKTKSFLATSIIHYAFMTFGVMLGFLS